MDQVPAQLSGFDEWELPASEHQGWSKDSAAAMPGQGRSWRVRTSVSITKALHSSPATSFSPLPQA